MNDDLTQAQTERQRVWTRHWSSGATHSCAGSYEGSTYGGAIAAFWQALHASTPAGAHVLDVATGRGALPRLLLQARPELEFQIDAIDIAQLDAAWLADMAPVQAARATFHARVSAESLPFENGRFDLVVSQYGLEYADLERALPELLRVRAEHGRIGLVLHHANSRPVTLAGVEIDHIDWLRGPDGLLPATAAILEPLARAGTPQGRARLAADPLAEAARVRFGVAQDAAEARALACTDGADVLGETRDAVSQIIGLALQQGEGVARAAQQLLDQRLVDARWRLSELRQCALDAGAAQRLCGWFEAAGLAVVLQELHDGPHLMGWSLTAS